MPDLSTVKNRIEESVRTMKGLHSVVSGIAITAGIRTMIEAPPKGVAPIDYAWLVALVVTIIPFNHGALRHMDDVYIYPTPGDPQPKKGALLIDFSLLFFEACILFYLSQIFLSFQSFVPAYVVLLGFDIFWALAVFFLTTNRHALKWLAINFGFGMVVLLFFVTTALDATNKSRFILLFVILRTLVDYIVNWPFYFPYPKEQDATKPAALVLDLDVSAVFETSEAVNSVLRSLISAFPKNAKRE
jgi:hypothetical protein